MQQPRKVDVRWEWINQGWEMYQKQLGNWLLLSLTTIVITLIPLLFFGIFTGGMAGLMGVMRGNRIDPTEIQAMISGTSILMSLISVIIGAIISAFFYAGLFKAASKQLRGEQISINDLFSGGEHFGSMVVATIIISILTQIGCRLCLIPGMVVIGLFFFTYPLIVNRGLGPIEAMKTSLQVTGQNWLMFILFGTVVYIVAGIGILACCVGIIFTFPLLFLITTVAYRDCFGTPGGYDSYEPPPPPIYGGYEPPPPPPSSWQ